VEQDSSLPFAQMPAPSKIFLDSAATSWPKPPAVLDAIQSFYRDCGRSPGRGDYASSAIARALVEQCRSLVREITRARTGDAVVLTHGGTEALNLAIQGLMRPGDQAVASTLEHNSVLRPLFAARDRHGCQIDLVEPGGAGRIDPGAVDARISARTRLVCLTHASNVTGMVQDIQAVALLCRQRNVPLLVDASQSLGRVPLDFSGWGIDLLAAAGHKGLFGPLGTGLLVVRAGMGDELQPVLFGGTGGDSELEHQPEALPWRLEPGSLDAGNIAGLAAGIRFVLETGVERIRAHELELDRLFRQRVRPLPGVELLGSESPERIAVSSLVVPGRDPTELAMILDASFGVEVRSGWHCAPRASRTVLNPGGQPTLRFSPGWYNTQDDVERAAQALQTVLSAH
jgi:cysteine desulfurase / selenocysteine lyase